MSELIVSAQTSIKEENVLKIKNTSILKRGSRKHWIVRYDVFIDNNIVAKRKEESTKVLLSEKSQAYMKSTYLPAWIAKKEDELINAKKHSTKFSYYAKLHLEDYKRNRDYENMQLKVQRVVADFGDIEIADINKLDVRKWVNNLPNTITGEELSRATRKKYQTVFNQIFDFALDDNVIERNFIPDIKVVGKKSNKDAIKIFSKQEVALLLEKSKSKKYGELLHPYIGLVFNEGISPSEAIGLQAGDIKVNTNGRKFLHIQRSITKNKEGDTKNEYRNRKIILRDGAEEFVEILLTLAKKRNSIWLFSNEDGSRLSDIAKIRGTKAYFNNKKGYYEHKSSKWYKLLEDLGLEFRQLKNCRHTFAMAMLESKRYSPAQLADMLGHSDLQMIINHYAKDIRGKAMDMDGSFDIYEGDTLGDTNESSKILKLDNAV